jgi:hypothetical protein
MYAGRTKHVGVPRVENPCFTLLVALVMNASQKSFFEDGKSEAFKN